MRFGKKNSHQILAVFPEVLFFSSQKKNCQLKPGQNNNYDIPQISDLTQVWEGPITILVLLLSLQLNPKNEASTPTPDREKSETETDADKKKRNQRREDIHVYVCLLITNPEFQICLLRRKKIVFSKKQQLYHFGYITFYKFILIFE